MSQQGRAKDQGSETLTGNTGGPVSPDGSGNINIVGSSPITVSGNPGTNTLTVEGDGTLVKTFTTNSGIATPASDNIDILGDSAQGISTSGAGDTITLTNSDSSTTQKGVSELATSAETITGTDTTLTIPPSALTAKLGTQTDNGVAYGDGSTNSIQWTSVLTDGQLVIGSTAGNPNAADLTSSGGTIVFTPGSNSLNLDTSGAIASSVPVDSGGPAIPSSGAFSILGNSSTDFTNSSGMVSHVGATTNEIYLENRRWFSSFIVDPSSTVGLRGEYTTVQAAITAATAAGGGIIYIRPGIYVEDITLEDNISLIGLQANLGNEVQIQGTVTVEYTGRCDIENLYFVTTGASLFVSTTGTAQLNMTNCFFVSSIGPICLSSNPSLVITIDFCGFVPAFADIFSMSAGNLTVRYSSINAFFGNRKRILASGTAVYNFRFSIVDHFFETQGTATISLFNNTINSTTTETLNVNSAGSTISSFNNGITCTAASGDFAIGTGTFEYGETLLPGTALDIAATLTEIKVGSRPRATSAASAAAVDFGTCGFDSTEFSLSDGFVNLDGSISSSFPTDTGTAVPVVGALTVSGGTLIGTTGAGSTVTVSADDNVVGSVATDSGTVTPVTNSFTISGGVGISTTGAGATTTIDSTFGGIDINEITVTGPTSMVEDTGYIANNAAQVDLALPLTSALGSILKINGKGAGGWIISQNAGQTIHFLAQDTTTGVGGSLASSTQYDCVTIRCITATTDWVVESVVGNLTVV